MPQKQSQTIEITNFGGRLSRLLNGDLNSGFAKFATSFGYDPFSKPGNLTWLEQPTDITGTAVTDLILDGIPRVENGQMYMYMIGDSGKLYKIQPNTISNPQADSVVGISSVKATNITFNYGASMALFNYPTASTLGRLYVGGDGQINTILTDGSGEALIGTIANYVQNRYRPLKQFGGKLLFGNGNAIGAIDSTNTVISPVTNTSSIYSQLNPLFPPETYVNDLEVSPDGNYLLIAASGSLNEQPTNFGATADGNLQPANVSTGYVYGWNGSDQAATTSNFIGEFSLNAVQSYLQQQMFFINDTFGSSLNNGTAKILTMPFNKSPFPNATAVNGNFLCWLVPEINTTKTGIHASLYYFGALDGENQPGLWRVMVYTSSISFVPQVPFHTIVNSNAYGLDTSASSVITLGYGKHYFSTLEDNSLASVRRKLHSFLITPTGSGVSQLGTYETQTQLFGKRITVKQIRVYTEPTVANNGFEIDCIGSDGNVITNGAFTYTYAAGTDITKLQGALERIDFNPAMKDIYSLGLRITNTGTANMTIHKIEVDYAESGK